MKHIGGGDPVNVCGADIALWIYQADIFFMQFPLWGQLYDGNFNHTVSSFGIEPRGFKVDYCKRCLTETSMFYDHGCLGVIYL